MSEPADATPPKSAADQAHGVLMRLLEERDAELYRRLGEVGRLAVQIAERLGMSNDELEDVRRAAELHDIGKVAIADTILSKPGPLTGDERATIRENPVVAERIIAAAPALAPVAALIRASYEHWDGSGYPDGLQGESIPLGARIVYACDAFDAMTGPRPHVRAMSVQEAIAELRMGAGKQFDPQVVEVLVEVWEARA